MKEGHWALFMIGSLISLMVLGGAVHKGSDAAWVAGVAFGISFVGVPLHGVLTSNSWSARRLYNRYLSWKLDRAEKAKGWRLETLRLKEQLRAAGEPTDGAELSLVGDEETGT